MHAVHITFQSTLDRDDLAAPFADYARALQAVDGLILKTWIADGTTFGGFYVFENRAVADAYLTSALVAGLTANPAFSEFTVQHYTVLEELSATTGTPTLARA